MVLAWVALIACILTYTVEWHENEHDHEHPSWDRPEYRDAMTKVGQRVGHHPAPQTCSTYRADQVYNNHSFSSASASASTQKNMGSDASQLAVQSMSAVLGTL